MAAAVSKEMESAGTEQKQQKAEKDILLDKSKVQPETLQKKNTVQPEKTVKPAGELIQPQKKSTGVPKIRPQAGKNRQLTATTGNKPSVHSQNTAKSFTNDAVSPVPAIVKARPLYNKNPKPAYPPLARRRGWQGTVILKVIVSEDGLAEQVTLYKSSGYPLLDTTAWKAVNSWRFLPGSTNGRSVTMNVLVPVHFRLD